MDFKKIIANDVETTFLNLSEFADTHILNGVEVSAVVDDDMLDGEVSLKFHGSAERKMSGLYNGGIVLYVAQSVFPSKPKPGAKLELDGKIYVVEAASAPDGMYQITMNRIGGR